MYQRILIYGDDRVDFRSLKFEKLSSPWGGQRSTRKPEAEIFHVSTVNPLLSIQFSQSIHGLKCTGMGSQELTASFVASQL